jgi:predicted 3-demethylubiquinone-9 3-methyltransferase (glyoxalase superfamily)
VQKIVTYLWYNGAAEEAANYYVEVLGNGRIVDVQRWGEGGPFAAGTAMLVVFELHGQTFMALNGGPQYSFTPAISLFVSCETQEEIDHLWAKLTDGGEEQPCGWLVDRYGLSWQIIPTALGELMSDPDPEKAQRVVGAMLQMGKIEIAGLVAARDGRG